MLTDLPNDILDTICYNNETLQILKNIMLTNKTLFNFIILKFEKLFLSNLQCDYKNMLSKYKTFYIVDLLEDYSLINLNKFKNCKRVTARSCYNITNVSLLYNVKYIDLSNCFELSDVSSLGNCDTLLLANCHKITDISHLSKVKNLDLSYCNKIEDISNLGQQFCLNLRGTNICNIKHLCNVDTLDISYNFNIYDISALKNVRSLDISFCQNIEFTETMNNYELIAENSYLIDDDIYYLRNIKLLDIKNNYYITDISPLKKTEQIDIRKCKNINKLPEIKVKIDVLRGHFYTHLIQLNNIYNEYHIHNH